MAVFEIFEGRPGQGKSLYLARKVRTLLKRNKKFYEETGRMRYIYCNFRLSETFRDTSLVELSPETTELTGESQAHLIQYWDSVSDLVNLRDVDVLWDEIANELDSRNFADLSLPVKKMLSHHRKRGIEIYANTQDFSMVDLRVRLMTSNLSKMVKVCGSPDPSATRPEIKKIWGVIFSYRVLEVSPADPHEKDFSPFPSVFFIRKSDTDIYSTTEESKNTDVRVLRHVVHVCEDPNCNYTRVVHK